MSVFFYGDVNSDQSGELAFFLQNYAGQPVTIVINSAGGSAISGAADAAAIEAHGQVSAIGRGIVASSATLPFVVAKTRLIHPACVFMIHNPSVLAAGTANDLRGTAAQLDVLGATYREFYARCTGLPAARIEAMMAAETWMGAEETISLGFADGLEAASEEDLPAVASFDPSRFLRPPAHLLAAMAASPKGPMMPATQTQNPPAKGADMSKVKAALLSAGISMDAAPQIAAAMGSAINPTQLRQIATMANIEKYSADDLVALVAAVADPEEQSGDPVVAARGMILTARMNADIALSGGSHSGYAPQASVGRSWDDPAAFRAKMVAGLTAKLTGAAPAPEGREAANMSLDDIVAQCAKRAGLSTRDAMGEVRMGGGQLSTSDLPLILEGSLTNLVGREAGQRMPDFVRASREIPRSDYRPGNVLNMSASAMPSEIAEAATIKHVTVDEKGEAAPMLRDFAALFNLSNKAWVNDSTALGMLQDLGRKMAEGSVERFRVVLLEPLLANAGAGMTMADGKTMFHADHGNLAATGAALSISSLSFGRLALRTRKDSRGALKPIDPWALVVPPELETVAQQLLAEIAAATVSDVNPFSGKLELIVEPGLNSATAWYLTGNPAQHDGHAHAFLDGQSRPRIETRPGWTTLGMEFRLTWAVDAKFIDTASWYRNPGI